MKKKLAKITTRILSVLLAAVLLAGCIPGVMVYAAANTIDGSVDPEEATNSIENVVIPAGQTVSFNIMFAANYHLIVTSNDITVTFKEKAYPAVNGEVNVFLQKNSESVQFQITNHASKNKSLTLFFSRHEGHKSNPIKLSEMKDFTVFQQITYANYGLDQEGTFYSWTAPSDGTLSLKVASTEPANLTPMVVINETLEAAAGSVSMKVVKGQNLEIQIAALSSGIAPDARIHVQASFLGSDETPPETHPPETEPPETEPPAALPPHTCHVEGYDDVELTAWYHEALDYMVDEGYMEGVGGNKMSPEGKLTRAQWAKLLYEVEGAPSVAGMDEPFADIEQGAWYFDAIRWAYNSGVVKGLSEHEFGPNSEITREQMAAMLYRYAGSPAVRGGLYAFLDGNKVSEFAFDAMVWATQNAIINGVGNGKLEPQGKATRAQAAKILYEYDK